MDWKPKELMRDLTFDIGILKTDLLQWIFTDKPYMRKALDKNRTKALISDLLKTYHMKDTLDLEITGDIYKGKGIGKSFSAVRLKEIFDTEYYGSYQDELTFYTIDEYLLHHMKHPDLRQSVSIVDENVELIGTGSYSQKVRFDNIMTTNRFRSNSTFRCATRYRDMVVEHVVKPLFIDYNNHVCVSLIYDYQNRYPLGSLCLQKPEDSLIKQYEKWKDEHITRMVKQDYRRLYFDEIAAIIIEKYTLKPVWEEMLRFEREKAEFNHLPLKERQQGNRPMPSLERFTDGDLRAYISREGTYTGEEKDYIITTIKDALKGKKYLKEQEKDSKTGAGFE